MFYIFKFPGTEYIVPVEGVYYIFPLWLNHCVYPFREEGENIIQQFEQWDAIRMFHMNGDLSDADSLEPSLQGYSVGRWEEDMLLVETTNISWPYFDEYGTPQTENMIIEEKFSFDQNNDTLKWEATINEPHAFDSPVTLARDYQWIPGEELKPYNCEFERD